MSRIAFVDLAAVHDELGAEMERAALDVVRSQRFIGGAPLAEFERGFAEQLEAAHVVGVANGTDAITLALVALGVGAGDEVLVPGNTFIATAAAVVAAGATPRFTDVDPDSGLIDLGSCAERVTAATRAIIPVHLYGRVCEMADVAEFAAEHGLRTIEDAAQAHGARRDGRAAGTFADAGTFSFYPGKNLGAFGDAGAITTNDDEVAATLRLLRDHGRSEYDEHVVVGYNSRLDAVQAAVLNVKLPRLAEWTERRREVARLYRDSLPAEILDWRGEDPAAESHHLFPVMVDDRDGLAAHLGSLEIDSGVHYREALCDAKAFAGNGDECPHATRRAARQLSLPIHPHLSGEQVERVVAGVTGFLEGGNASAGT